MSIPNPDTYAGGLRAWLNDAVLEIDGARAAKNYAHADMVRARVREQGCEIETRDGKSVWRYVGRK